MNRLIVLCFQATIAPPIKGKMFKGLCVCYLIIAITYFSVGISGYWAFGNQAKAIILSNFNGKDKNGQNLLPTWFLLLTNASTIAQILAITLVIIRSQIASLPKSCQHFPFYFMKTVGFSAGLSSTYQ